MIKSAVVNEQYGSYDDSIWYFTSRILKCDDVEDGYLFMEELAYYLDGSKFPCDKIILNPFCTSNEFGIRFNYNGKEVSRCVFFVDKYHLFKIKGAYYAENCIKEMFHNIIEKYFDELNQSVVDEQSKKAGIGDDNKVILEYYDDYKQTDRTVELNGNIREIFDKYTSMNETLKYCNGSYYKFADKEVEKLYYMFTSSYKGNYFLDNAVKDGRIID